jgi:type II secretory pathway pseudopilin PulG
VLSGRRGHLLAEALCALALAGALAATAAIALTGAQRSTRALEERERAGRAERETLAVLRAALETGNVLALRGDTAVDLDLTLALAPACAVETRALLLPPAVVADGAPLTAALQPPDAGDIAAVRLADGPRAAPVWVEYVVDSLQPRTLTGVCDASDGWASVADADAPRWRVTFLDTLPSDLELGATVRLARPGRFTLYHAGGGDWMFGWRRCTPDLTVCGVVQPISGPLRTPAAGGLRIRAFDDPPRWELEARGAGSAEGARATVYR